MADSFLDGIALNGQKATGLGTPTASGDAATKGYVDGLLVGAALSVLGVAINSAGVRADIVASAAGGAGVLTFNSDDDTLQWLQAGAEGVLTTDGVAVSWSATLPLALGGTGATTAAGAAANLGTGTRLDAAGKLFLATHYF